VERVRCLVLPVSRRCSVYIRSIRFAAPPTGNLRWQAPQPPTFNRSGVIQANAFAPFCPQNPDAPNGPGPAYGDEDCLFLNVYAPANASSLPVLVWIHGGGYGAGNGREDLSPIINANHNNFVGVAIQYRVRDPMLRRRMLVITDVKNS
jgi:carboxylesterase type B